MNILHHFRTTMLAAFPGLDAPTKAFFRIARTLAGRVNLQAIYADLDQTKDLRNVEICPGVPGVTSDPTDGEVVLTAFVGKDRIPHVIARASEQQPGHTPVEVRHDASSAIRMLSRSASLAAKLYVGSAPTVPVAKSLEVEQFRAAVLVFAAACKPIPPALAPTLQQIGAAAIALEAALLAVPSFASSNLEAK